jgi:hypothetical protein
MNTASLGVWPNARAKRKAVATVRVTWRAPPRTTVRQISTRLFRENSIPMENSHARDEEDQDQRESDPLKEEDHHQREPQDDDQVG